MFICTEKYTETDKTLKIIIRNTKHTKNIQMHFQLPFLLFSFSEVHKLWAPWASPDSFWAKKLICLREKYARCDYTSATCLQLAKNAKNIRKPVRIVPSFFFFFCIFLYMSRATQTS